jgi:hypothetical protein
MVPKYKITTFQLIQVRLFYQPAWLPRYDCVNICHVTF